MDWDQALRRVRTARWPVARGKPIEKNTRLLVNEAFDTIRLRYHNTDIIVFKPDGERFIHTGWTSRTTLDRFRESSISVGYCKLPTLNGYLTNPERAYFVSVYRNSGSVAFRGNARAPDTKDDSYIRVTPDGQFDLSTVVAHQVQCVVDPQALRKRMKHLGRVVQLAMGYAKLKGGERQFGGGTVHVNHWLMERAYTPLEEIQLSPFPNIWDEDPRAAFKTGLDNIRWDIARQNGWIGAASLLKTLTP